MQLVAADIGNHSIKIAVEHAAVDGRWSMESIIRADSIHNISNGDLNIDSGSALWSVSSVNQHRQRELADWIHANRPQDEFYLIGADEINLQTDVVSRDRLGRDRLIAAWQAVQLNDSGPVIVIDAGTAVTVDLVDEQPMFQGGLIFPGAESASKILADQTDALPDLGEWFASSENASSENGIARFGSASADSSSFIGKSTESAIWLGIYQSQVCTLQAVVNGMTRALGTAPAVFITGGGAEKILPGLPGSWQFVPDLVLQGAFNLGRQRHLS